MRIITTNNFRYKKIAAKDPYRQGLKLIQQLNKILQEYWKNINKYVQQPPRLQSITQVFFKNLNQLNSSFASLDILMGKLINVEITNLTNQLQQQIQQMGTQMPGTLRPDGSVVQPVNLSQIQQLLKRFNENITQNMYTATQEHAQQREQELEQQQMQIIQQKLERGELGLGQEMPNGSVIRQTPSGTLETLRPGVPGYEEWAAKARQQP